jgi:transcriptional regulator with XRE-family HTH domain
MADTPTLVPLSLGARLRAHRRQFGMTLEYCGLVLGLPTSVVQQLERDTPPWLSLAQRQRLAHVLDCPLTALGLPDSRRRRGDAGRTQPSPARPALVSFGQRLRAIRRAHGWSQTHLGDLLGVCHTIISRLENDRILNPRLLFVRCLADVLHCSTDALIGREEGDAAQASAPSVGALAGPQASAPAALEPHGPPTARAGRGASLGEIRR